MFQALWNDLMLPSIRFVFQEGKASFLKATTLHGQNYVDTCSSNISFQNHGHKYGVGPPFAAVTSSILLGRLSTCCWNNAVGICFLSATRALVRSGIDVGRLGLARSRRPNSPQRYLMGFRSGFCAGQSSSSAPISPNHFCIDLTL